MYRINIIGPSGAGKSTLARELGYALEIPVIHLDTLFFKPNWEPIPKDEFLKQVEELTSLAENWIIEGNYTDTWKTRFPPSNCIIFLDYPRRIYFFRVLKRLIQNYGKTRPDAAIGCPERLDGEFLKFVWDFPKRRNELLKRLKQETTPVKIFKSPKEISAFLKKSKRKTPCMM
ncbi:MULTISPECIES: topology modulation protein [Listeria]|uniref:topology modulation protein n=1 Tax=Listeria TaxID=1637 RepID=UPI000B597C95|nr:MULTISPECIES: topology modulation protein [Listeria]